MNSIENKDLVNTVHAADTSVEEKNSVAERKKIILELMARELLINLEREMVKARKEGKL